MSSSYFTSLILMLGTRDRRLNIFIYVKIYLLHNLIKYIELPYRSIKREYKTSIAPCVPKALGSILSLNF